MTCDTLFTIITHCHMLATHLLPVTANSVNYHSEYLGCFRHNSVGRLGSINAVLFPNLIVSGKMQNRTMFFIRFYVVKICICLKVLVSFFLFLFVISFFLFNIHFYETLFCNF